MLKIPTVFFLITISLLAILHILALEFFLYWRFWWFDILTHFIGGLAVALGIFTLYDFRIQLPPRLLNLIPVLAGVVIAGLAWELFELWANLLVIEKYLLLDTASDLLSGAIGGVVGFFIGSALSKL